MCVDWTLLGRGYEDYANGGDGDRRVQSLRSTAAALAPSGAKVADYFSHLCPDGKFTQTAELSIVGRWINRRQQIPGARASTVTSHAGHEHLLKSSAVPSVERVLRSRVGRTPIGNQNGQT